MWVSDDFNSQHWKPAKIWLYYICMFIHLDSECTCSSLWRSAVLNCRTPLPAESRSIVWAFSNAWNRPGKRKAVLKIETIVEAVHCNTHVASARGINSIIVISQCVPTYRESGNCGASWIMSQEFSVIPQGDMTAWGVPPDGSNWSTAAETLRCPGLHSDLTNATSRLRINHSVKQEKLHAEEVAEGYSVEEKLEVDPLTVNLLRKYLPLEYSSRNSIQHHKWVDQRIFQVMMCSKSAEHRLSRCRIYP